MDKTHAEHHVLFNGITGNAQYSSCFVIAFAFLPAEPENVEALRTKTAQGFAEQTVVLLLPYHLLGLTATGGGQVFQHLLLQAFILRKFFNSLKSVITGNAIQVAGKRQSGVYAVPALPDLQENIVR